LTWAKGKVIMKRTRGILIGRAPIELGTELANKKEIEKQNSNNEVARGVTKFDARWIVTRNSAERATRREGARKRER